MPHEVDVLHVAAGTTGGWRVNDARLDAALRDLGLSVEHVAITRPAGGYVRSKGPPLADLVDAGAMVASARRGLRAGRPRAILYSTSHATILQPPRRIPEAVWIDGPIAIMRPGRRCAPLRSVERLRSRRLDLVLPSSLQHPELLAAPLRPRRTVALHMPIDPFDGPIPELWDLEPPFAVTYAGAPRKKGLEMAVRAWHLSRAECPLVVTGIGREEAARYLRERGGAPPAGIRFTGRVPQAVHRGLVREAEIYVSASRREEYGTSQMEALADGCLLATVPSAGAAEPIAVARRLPTDLIATEIATEALATVIDGAVAMSAEARARYRQAAGRLLAEYSTAEFRRRLADDVLPVLLSG